MSQVRQIVIKSGLVAFGLLLGILVLAFGVEILDRIQEHRGKGSDFGSLNELRAEMVSSDQQPANGGSVSLRAIIYPHPDDHIIYDLRPNISVTFQKVPVRTNSCGMRGAETTISKPPGVYRIALLGDSFTFGWGVDEDKIFARVLENTLNRTAKNGIRFEVLNFGVPGYSTFQEVSKFIESGADFNPDAVLVYFISNDFGYPFFVRDVTRSGGMLSGLEFTRLLGKALNPEMEDQRLLMGGLDPNSSMKILSDFTRERGIKLSFALNPYRKWEKDKSRMKILDERSDIEFIDMKEPLLYSIDVRKIPLNELQLPDDPHPSAKKHEIFGQILASYYLGVTQ